MSFFKIVVKTFVLIVFITTSLFAQSVKVLKSEFIFSKAPFKQCHASTIVELKDQKLMAAWFGGSHENAKDVCIWASIFEDKKWSSPQKIICGKIADTSTACWNPVLFKTDSLLLLYYKQGKSPREWQSMLITSTDFGNNWSKPIALSDYSGPVKNKPFITKNGTWLNGTSTETLAEWHVFIERSTNQGKSFQIIPIDTSNPIKVIQPTFIQEPNNIIHALCRSNQNVIMESISVDDGKHWTKLSATNISNPNSGIDALTLKNGKHLLVYNPTIAGKKWWEGRNQLVVAISNDAKNWNTIYELENHQDGEFSYPAIIQTSDKHIHLLYTYNRENIKHVELILE
jgi:predicted neuraminidase